jgi:hypothetical protein
MKPLMKKELLLSMHPTAPIFLLLSSMLIIPNYPYYVVFFYTGLAVFFTCLSGRENHDVFYTLMLPVAKKDIVKARYAFVILLEAAQMIAAVPFAVIRQHMPLPGNQVGMDANIALFGFAFAMLGLFNFVFFSIYYRDVNEVGKAFVWSSTAVFLFITAAEACAHIVPFVRDRLDTADPQYLSEKLAVLGIGFVIGAALTWLAFRKSVRSFERLDL